ncbi:MAG: hypothetical protein A2Y07_00235 [Planctomycetes bacterium GWF2_50_10]|nr:MAG: hypothetical protein A2Y07_00235 [Planctomycetes bacterium GWF2_50_10]
MTADTVLQILTGVAAALFIGIAKAGFVGGLGILVTPQAALVYPSRVAIGLVLPLLIVTDIFSLYFYWRKWNAHNVRWLVPGALAGIFAGIMLIGRLDDQVLVQLIGGIAFAFIGIRWQLGLSGIQLEEYHPKQWQGTLFGLVVGVTTTIVHAGSPVVAFIDDTTATAERALRCNNCDVFCPDQLDQTTILLAGILQHEYVPGEPGVHASCTPGVWLGVCCSRRLTQTWFIRSIYVTLFATGMYLLLQDGMSTQCLATN